MAGNVRRLVGRKRPVSPALRADNREPGAIVAALGAPHFRRVVGAVGARPKAGGCGHDESYSMSRVIFKTGQRDIPDAVGIARKEAIPPCTLREEQPGQSALTKLYSRAST